MTSEHTAAWAALHALARQQDYVVTAQQAREAGIQPSHARRLSQAGTWVPLPRGAYWLRQNPHAPPLPPLRARVRAALLTLGPQVLAMGQTAARLQGLQGLPQDDGILHLAAPPTRAPKSRHPIHIRRLALPPECRTQLHGLPLTTPARTCLDVLPELDRMHAVSLLDSALHRGLLLPADLPRLRVHLSGRRGAHLARQYLDQADGRAESPLETRIRLLALDGGLPPPVLQWRIQDPDHGCHYRIDLGWPQFLLGLEADGLGPHGTPQALYRDRHRQNRLATLLPGLTLLRFTWADTYRPDVMLRSIRQALRVHDRDE